MGVIAAYLVGVITQIEWTHPHSPFYLDVENAKASSASGDVRQVIAACARGRDWRRGDIKIGDTLIADAFLA
jgi:hypothetical protein